MCSQQNIVEVYQKSRKFVHTLPRYQQSNIVACFLDHPLCITKCTTQQAVCKTQIEAIRASASFTKVKIAHCKICHRDNCRPVGRYISLHSINPDLLLAYVKTQFTFRRWDRNVRAVQVLWAGTHWTEIKQVLPQSNLGRARRSGIITQQSPHWLQWYAPNSPRNCPPSTITTHLVHPFLDRPYLPPNGIRI